MGRLKKEKGGKSQIVDPSAAKQKSKKKLDENLVTDDLKVDDGLRNELEGFLGDLKNGKGKEKAKKEPKQKKDAPKPSVTPTPSVTPKRTHKKDGIVPPVAQWHAILEPLPSTSLEPPSPAQLQSLTSKGASLLETLQSSTSKHSSEQQFMQSIISSGTLSDRLSALTLLVQGAPMYNIRALETLKTMAERGKGSGGREESLKSLRCVVDWWVGGGAPDRKLKYLRDQPNLTHPKASDAHIVVWYFEDWLKKYFFNILQTLETLTHDPLIYIRTQAIALIFNLLKAKPEQEQNLLRLGIGGLADSTPPLPSTSTHHILTLLQLHPAMKSVVVNEVCDRILRIGVSPISTNVSSTSTLEPPKQNKHIRFTSPSDDLPKKPSPKNDEKRPLQKGTLPALLTLTQIVLSPAPADKVVAQKLVSVYFDVFTSIIPSSSSRDKDDDEGAQNDEVEVEVKKDSKGNILVPRSKKGKGKSKPTNAADHVGEDNSKIMSALLTGIRRAVPFAGIDEALTKNLEPLFVLASSPNTSFNVSLQSLTLLERVVSSSSSSAPNHSKKRDSKSTSSSQTAAALRARFYRTLYASLLDSRLGESGKEAMYLNLFVKAVKGLCPDPSHSQPSSTSKRGKEHAKEQGEDWVDADRERVLAIVHRFFQLLVSGSKSGNAEFVEGGLVCVAELCDSVPSLRGLLMSPKQISDSDSEAYDRQKRDPAFAHASCTSLWELTPFLTHYHPTISLHASQLLQNIPLSGASTDMGLNTLSHFLDRFVFKNPKKIKTSDPVVEERGTKVKGSSMMQPANSEALAVKRVRGEQSGKLGLKASAIGEEYLRVWEEGRKARAVATTEDSRLDNVSEDEMSGEGDTLDGDSDFDGVPPDEMEARSDESEGDEAEDEIWKAIKASMPSTGLSDASESGDDDDGDLDGLDDAMSALSDSVEDLNGSDDGLAEASDTSELLPLNGLMDYDGSSASEGEEDEEWDGIETNSGNRKRKGHSNQEDQRKKKKVKLPTFVSYEDYSQIIEEGAEDSI